MHLYIRTSEFTKEITEVTLKDGCVPVINEHIPVPANSGKIEPAVWFKVLVLDSVSIDCVRRVIKWNTEDVGRPRFDDTLYSGKRSRMSRQLYSEGECYDFESNLDELFDTAQSLVQNYAGLKISQNDFNETVLRLLHCYILPAIKLRVEDLEKVEEAHREVTEHVSLLDQEIVQKNNSVQITKMSLDDQRRRLLGELALGKVVKTPPLEMIQLLQTHLERDLHVCGERLNDAQDEVNAMRERVQEGKNSETELQDKRRKRDKCQKELEKLIGWREMLRSTEMQAVKKTSTFSLRRSFRTPKKISHPFHKMYIECHKKLQELREELRRLTDTKVLILSVKEAIRSTVAELRSGIDTVGIETSRGGSRKATDVLTHNSIPLEWQTLSEKVLNCITEPASPMTRFHNDFVSKLLEQCSAALYENNLCSTPDGACVSFLEDRSSSMLMKEAEAMICLNETERFQQQDDVFSMEPSPPSEERMIQRVGRLHRRDSEEMVFICDTEIDILKETKTRLKLEIHEHFDDMTLSLQDVIGNASPLYYNKLWLCYESHFYETMMDTLKELYLKSYYDSMHSLKKHVEEFSISDLEFEDHEQWILLMLEKDDDSGYHGKSGSCHGCSCDSNQTNESAVSLEITSSIARRRHKSQPCKIKKYETLREDVVNWPPSLDEAIDISALRGEDDSNREAIAPECALDALDLAIAEYHMQVDAPSVSPPPRDQYQKNILLQTKGHVRITIQESYMEKLAPVIECIDLAIEQNSILEKLKQLTRCLRVLSALIPEIRCQVLNIPFAKEPRSPGQRTSTSSFCDPSGNERGMSADDIVTLLVLVLLNCDGKVVAKLYPHLVMMSDLMAPFLESGVHSYSLVQFHVAYQFLFSKIVKFTH